MSERKINLLTDEEISLILTALRLSSSKYMKDNDTDNMVLSDMLYDRINACYEMGVIVNEKN